VSAVPTDGREDHWLELAATVLLALAAIGTAWATYQSSSWHGRQAEAQSASIAARVESTREANVANREGQVDLAIFTQWVDAYAHRETELTDFYRKRFRAEFEPAFEAWVATKPLTNPAAPLSPFAMPQYKLEATRLAERKEAEAAAYSQDVKTYVQRADDYTLAVVVFAISLFFAALSTRMHTRGSRLTLLAMGYVLFLGTVVWLATQPVSVGA